MVERLDAPQPTFPLPPLADIPDESVDKADDAKRIVNSAHLIPSFRTRADLRYQTTYFGPADAAFPTVPAVVLGAASFSTFYNDDDHIRGVTPLRTTRLALRCVLRHRARCGDSDMSAGMAFVPLIRPRTMARPRSCWGTHLRRSRTSFLGRLIR